VFRAVGLRVDRGEIQFFEHPLAARAVLLRLRVLRLLLRLPDARQRGRAAANEDLRLLGGEGGVDAAEGLPLFRTE
jgi:hypothetical protein